MHAVEFLFKQIFPPVFSESWLNCKNLFIFGGPRRGAASFFLDISEIKPKNTCTDFEIIIII